MRLRRAFPYVMRVLVAVGLDQWVKALVEARLAEHEMIEMVPFLALYRTHNTGIAFSMLSQLGDKGLIVVALGVIALVLVLAWRTRPGQVFARAGFALVVGGAIGNLIDRAMLGHVVDYILFHTPIWSFAVFNLADAFITVGAFLVLLQEIIEWRRERKAASTSEPQPPE